MTIDAEKLRLALDQAKRLAVIDEKLWPLVIAAAEAHLATLPKIMWRVRTVSRTGIDYPDVGTAVEVARKCLLEGEPSVTILRVEVSL